MNEPKQNPYATPKAKLERFDLAIDLATFKPFSTQGRLARLRYTSFTLGIISIALIITFFIVSIPIIGIILALFCFATALIINLMLSIQRCHDFNMTGWLALIYLIPLISLLLYFVPGTTGDNKYGKAPPENSIAVVVSAVLLVIVYSLSIGSLAIFIGIGSV